LKYSKHVILQTIIHKQHYLCTKKKPKPTFLLNRFLFVHIYQWWWW